MFAHWRASCLSATSLSSPPLFVSRLYANFREYSENLSKMGNFQFYVPIQNDGMKKICLTIV